MKTSLHREADEAFEKKIDRPGPYTGSLAGAQGEPMLRKRRARAVFPEFCPEIGGRLSLKPTRLLRQATRLRFPGELRAK